jgi:hypothetical protein|tara:strand:+ start:274 stop:420 length:147 start_codon:yes stop_codon:yes gene_type:complete
MDEPKPIKEQLRDAVLELKRLTKLCRAAGIDLKTIRLWRAGKDSDVSN